MPTTTIEELLEAGTHFGSWTHSWNPAMKPYIHGRRNKIHIINLVHTVRGLARASHFLREVAATGRQVIYVGTKRQMKGILLQEVARVEMPWVTERWLGGTLTNFKTVRSRLTRLEELEHMEATGEMAALKKKAQSQLTRQLRRIKKNMDGLRKLNRMPGAMLIVDPRREHIAVAEAKKMGVPVVALLDTDCDPRPIDIPIPANDDSMRSVGLLLGRLTDAIEQGVTRFRESGRAPEDAVGIRGEDGSMVAMEDTAAMARSMKASAGKAGGKVGAKSDGKTDGKTAAKTNGQTGAKSEAGAGSDAPGGGQDGPAVAGPSETGAAAPTDGSAAPTAGPVGASAPAPTPSELPAGGEAAPAASSHGQAAEAASTPPEGAAVDAAAATESPDSKIEG